MPQQQEQINLSEKSVIELKALAYDFQSVITQYTNMLNLVKQEIQVRVSQDQSSEKENVKVETAKGDKGKSKMETVK